MAGRLQSSKLMMLPQERVRAAEQVAEFAVSVVRLVRALPKPIVTDPVVGHLARCAADLTSNYRAACSASSRTEMTTRLAAAAGEAADAEHWLWMLGQLGLASGARFDALVSQSRDLRLALIASARLARRNRP